uniref:SET domain-containing protein n=1 Tax=Clastoptera arizonana TaxID=38151 RepID=A0A1B6DVF1_9HEMI
MGRTLRQRKRKKQLCQISSNTTAEKVDQTIIKLLKWMTANGWKSTCNLTPYYFKSTGRGLMTKKLIKNDDILVKIPGSLLITIKAVYDSSFGWVFSRGKTFTTQQVLSSFLVFEKHQELKSFWFSYISSLPSEIYSPVFCPVDFVNIMPQELREQVISLKSNIVGQYEEVRNSLSIQDICKHCGTLLVDIYTIDEFMWAWFIVNSRAVYISPDRNTDHSISLSDSNCLALAPYLDMLNHSDVVQVQAFINDSDDSYQIKTMVPFKRNDQVFIHYGAHSNMKLLLDYGFILPKNKNDVIKLNCDDVFKTIINIFPHKQSSSKQKYNFLKSHDLLSNTCCSYDGLSWELKILIFVLLSPEHMETKTIQRKVFSSDFSIEEEKDISIIGKALLEKKLVLFRHELFVITKYFDSLRDEFTRECYKLIIKMYENYIFVLDNVIETFSQCISV